MKPWGTRRIKSSCILLILVISANNIPGIFRETPVAARGLSTSYTSLPAHSTRLQPEQPSKVTELVYLPQVYNPDRIWRDTAIWAHSASPGLHEVALFRRTFTLEKTLEAAELQLFADTRYEVWIDGAWVGRGPARFTHRLREYDVHQLGALPPGEHLAAILVQWAPNLRRSESTRPHLIGHIRGLSGGLPLTVAPSNLQWKCLLSPAWQQEAVQIHSWRLIGPTELVDLRRLPTDWNQPGFDDSAWTDAQAVSISVPAQEIYRTVPSTYSASFEYRPRSIDLLGNFPITPTLMDAGLLSPGFAIGEIAPTAALTASLRFSNTMTSALTIETLEADPVLDSDVLAPSSEYLPSLSITEPFTSVLTSTIRLDGELLSWNPADSSRPDVIRASIELTPGDHSLAFDSIPAAGITFGVSLQDLRYAGIPFTQGVHAGRRLFLAEPASGLQFITVRRDPDLAIEMDRLPAYAVLDLGRTIHGRLQAKVSGPAGSILDIGWDERLYGSSARPMPYPGSMHPEWNQVDSWVLDGSTRTITTIDSRAGRYILIAAWGDAPVTIDSIQVFEERYPAQSTGSFHSSDPLLDKIWQVGLDTLYPNMTDAYTDTPWRERGQWWGDAYVADHINRVTTGDLHLLKRGLMFMTQAFDCTPAPGMVPNGTITHMLDYSMLWAASLSEYYRLTADRRFLVGTYPVLKRLVEYLGGFENGATSLLDLPQGLWSKVALVEWLGYDSRYGQSAAVNAMYYHTLLEAAYLAEQTDDSAAAQQWQQKAQAVKDNLNAQLYLADEVRYATTIFEGELTFPTVHAQAWPLAYDIVPAQAIHAVTSSMLEMLSPDPTQPNLDIYGMYWLLEALGRNGHIEDALAVIENYYGYLLAAGSTTWWEEFNADQRPSASLSHAWGGSPTWFLSTYVLGGSWDGPNTWRVAPPLTGLSYVSGSIPVNQGSLEISWERQTCQLASIEIHSEGDTRGEVIIPSGNPLLNVTHNGALVWDSAHQADGPAFITPRGLHLLLPGGDHTLTIEYDC